MLLKHGFSLKNYNKMQLKNIKDQLIEEEHYLENNFYILELI
jgi:hypothetical protein